MEFQAWQKTSRLFRPITVTEKIDGTNAAILFEPLPDWEFDPVEVASGSCGVIFQDTEPVVVGAQSRKRLITPDDDNFGFANWVWQNSASLFRDLGYGIHFGEWWGKGIQRGYGLDEKRFSLFNTKKWADAPEFETSGLFVVPILYEGVFDEKVIKGLAVTLEIEGSLAAPGFNAAEGVCIYFHQSNQVMKYTPYTKYDGHKG